MPVVAFQRGQVPPGAVEVRRASFRAFHRGPEKCCAGHHRATRSNPMMDILMLALGFGFFALAIGYTYACERL